MKNASITEENRIFIKYIAINLNLVPFYLAAGYGTAASRPKRHRFIEGPTLWSICLEKQKTEYHFDLKTYKKCH